MAIRHGRACDMERIERLDSLRGGHLRGDQQIRRFPDVFRSDPFPGKDSVFPLRKRILRVFEIQNIRPCKFDVPGSDSILDIQLRFGFQPDPDLRLIVEGSIEAAVVQINFHFFFPD